LSCLSAVSPRWRRAERFVGDDEPSATSAQHPGAQIQACLNTSRIFQKCDDASHRQECDRGVGFRARKASSLAGRWGETSAWLARLILHPGSEKGIGTLPEGAVEAVGCRRGLSHGFAPSHPTKPESNPRAKEESRPATRLKRGGVATSRGRDSSIASRLLHVCTAWAARDGGGGELPVLVDEKRLAVMMRHHEHEQRRARRG
jgi:hypothetical protein